MKKIVFQIINNKKHKCNGKNCNTIATSQIKLYDKKEKIKVYSCDKCLEGFIDYLKQELSK